MRDHLATFSLVTLHEIAPTIVPKQPVEALPPYCGPRKPVLLQGGKLELLHQLAEKARASYDLQPMRYEISMSDGTEDTTRFTNDDGQTIERTTREGRIVSERVVAPA